MAPSGRTTVSRTETGLATTAINVSSTLATFELGMLYQQGSGVAKDRKRAAELFKTAADAGNVIRTPGGQPVPGQ